MSQTHTIGPSAASIDGTDKPVPDNRVDSGHVVMELNPWTPRSIGDLVSVR